MNSSNEALQQLRDFVDSLPHGSLVEGLKNKLGQDCGLVFFTKDRPTYQIGFLEKRLQHDTIEEIIGMVETEYKLHLHQIENEQK